MQTRNLRLSLLFLIFSLPLLVKGQTKKLDDFLQEALQNSPLLAENQNLYKGVVLDSSKIRASQKPFLSLNSTAQFIPILNGFGYNQNISNGGNYLATVNLSQPLFNSFQKKSLYYGNQVKKDSLVNSSRISKIELKKSIINQYILAYSDQKLVQFQKGILDLYKNQDMIFKKLVQKGVYKQSDYLTFLVSLQAQEITITQAEISFHNDLSQLNSLSGITDTITYTLQDPGLVLNVLQPINTTYQFQKFSLDSLSLVAQRNFLVAAYRPKINWFADAGYEAPNFDSFYKSFGASVGISLSLPLYDGHQRKITSKQIDLLENTRKSYLNFFKREYTQEILHLKKQLNDQEILENQLKNQMHNNELLVEVDRKLLEIGEIKINDLILAINNYKNLQFSLIQLDLNRLNLINQLNFWSTNY